MVLDLLQTKPDFAGISEAQSDSAGGGTGGKDKCDFKNVLSTSLQ